MRQRLGVAAALLGDPQVLILDEPANGLDPEGIRWMRDLLRTLAAQGRTVLVSSRRSCIARRQHVTSRMDRGPFGTAEPGRIRGAT
jgi:ABC-type multidrug transport system ATPase subunit